MHRVIILTGPPGAGKSTTASRLARMYPKAVHLHTDDFWRYIVSGFTPPYLPDSDAQNHTVVRALAASATAYALGGFTVVVDGIVGPWMLDHYRDAARGHDVTVDYVVLRPSRDETLSRARGRTTAEALVDEGPILALWDQFADLGEFEPFVLDTTGHTPATTLEAVAQAVQSGRHRLIDAG